MKGCQRWTSQEETWWGNWGGVFDSCLVIQKFLLIFLAVLAGFFPFLFHLLCIMHSEIVPTHMPGDDAKQLATSGPGMTFVGPLLTRGPHGF